MLQSVSLLRPNGLSTDAPSLGSRHQTSASHEAVGPLPRSDFHRLVVPSFTGRAEHLIQAVIEEFRKQKVILPGMTVIERLAWEVRQRAEEKIFKHLVSALTTEQTKKWTTRCPTCLKAVKRTCHGFVTCQVLVPQIHFLRADAIIE
ncbi:DUF4158 domain-containing protein [Alicyclobacillus tolerans]|uniref:DUF4158 domain-containing protein n=1 Tax=Alicyclobacillus tolerans TaxID=90970 RepID=UPI003556F19C|nr:DUF4158 domain-containing protein [Alicyclobacillus tolerans]